MEQLTSRQKKLAVILYSKNDFITAKDLSYAVQVSVRTIKTEISIISAVLTKYGCKVISKNNMGYRLIAEQNKSLIDLFQEDLKRESMSQQERVNFLLQKLLVVDYHVQLEDLAQELYVSKSSINNLIRMVKEYLKKYRLTLVRRPNYGILIEGTEIDKRLAISEVFFHSNSNAEYNIKNSELVKTEESRKEYDSLVEYVRTACHKYKIEISDYTIYNLAVHIQVAIRRCIFYNYVIVPECVLASMQNTIEFKAATDIVRFIEQDNQFLMPMGEVVYLAQHISAKRTVIDTSLSSEYTKKLDQCIQLILSEINDNFGFDFMEDGELYRNLFLHIPAMLIRLKYHMPLRNPLVQDNMRRYLFATKVCHSACAIIEHMFQIQIEINEFGYLLLYFNLAISKFEANKPLQIAILTGRGRPETLMYSNELKEYFSSRKYVLTDIDHVEVENKYDLIVTTYLFENSEKYPVVLIHQDNYLEEVTKKVNHLRYYNFDFECFFSTDNCIFDLEGNNKEEVLDAFYEVLRKREVINEVPSDFQRMRCDGIGNGIVHFQDLYRIVRKNVCIVCTLKKTVYWDDDMVRVLILIKTKKNKDKDLYNLCRLVSRWGNNTQKVMELIKDKQFNILDGGIGDD